MFSKMTKYQQVAARTTLLGGCRLPPVLIETQSPDSRFQRLPGNPEFRGRAGGTRNSSVAFGKSSFDDFHFEICER
jgi:hypothetical protein